MGELVVRDVTDTEYFPGEIHSFIVLSHDALHSTCTFTTIDVFLRRL